MQRRIHVFDNGVKVYDDHLIPMQRDRYKRRNVHEAEEEDIFVEIVRAIPTDGCFVNIGSAIGYYPLLAKKLAPKLTIHAIEPLERHRKLFIENITLNGLSQMDFTIHEEGISSSDGKAKFVDSGYGSSIQRGGENIKEKEQMFSMKGPIEALRTRIGLKKFETTSEKITTIRTITLDNLINTIAGPVELLQMDVQGFEVDVLKGASHTLKTGNVLTFLIGTHSREIHQECIDLLREHGYVIEFNEPAPKEQPDGIVLASKGVRKLIDGV